MTDPLHSPNSFNPSSIFTALEDSAERMTEAKEKADNLTELRKSILAKLTLSYMKRPLHTSRLEAETRALADIEYREYIEGMNEAVRQANRAQAAFKNQHVLAELRRSEESSRRTLRV